MKCYIISILVLFTAHTCNNHSKSIGDLISKKNIISYYPFSGNANDQSLNLRNGIVNGATLIDDRYGKENSAYYFDGVDDYIELEKNDDFILGEKGAVMAWIRPESTGDNYSLLSNGSSNSPRDNVYNLVLNKYRDKWQILAYINGQQVNNKSNPMLHTYDQWYFIVYQWEKGGDVSLFVDGILEHKGKLLNAPVSLNNTNLRIGHLALTAYFKGTIDDLIICDKVFSEKQINKLFMKTVVNH